MPERTKKENKQSSDPTEVSRWHKFHFSGKVILCSVILGFMLVLIGGILMAINVDNEDDTKSGDYNDVQKRPPTIYVGPAIMGIGGFAVIVGVFMCLFETNVCRKKPADASPLITAGTVESETKDSDPTSVPSTSHHRDKHRHRTNKNPTSPRYKSPKKSSKPKNQMEASLSSSQSSVSSPTSESANSSKHFLTASDKFLTPSNSFPSDVIVREQSYAHNQASLMQSSTSSGKSWNTSVEFQTPAASFKDDPISLQFTDRKDEMSLNMPTTNTIENQNHKFLTPKNSDAEKETSMAADGNEQKQEQRNEQITADLSEKTKHSSSQINPEKSGSSEVGADVQRMSDGKNDCDQSASKNVPPVSGKEFTKSSSAEEIVAKSVQNISDINPDRVLDSKENEDAECSDDAESNAISHEDKERQAKTSNHGAHELLITKNTIEDKIDSNESDSKLDNIKADSEEINVSRTDSNSKNNEETITDKR